MRGVGAAVRPGLLDLGPLVADAGRHLVAVHLDHQLHVGDVDRRLLGDDATGRAATAALLLHLGVPLHAVHALHDDTVLVGAHGDDLALSATVTAGDHPDEVALLDTQVVRHHSTSGASEMILMNRLSRSSRPTGPKMRVPRGSPESARK